jgi:hypothetical protein
LIAELKAGGLAADDAKVPALIDGRMKRSAKTNAVEIIKKFFLLGLNISKVDMYSYYGVSFYLLIGAITAKVEKP